MADCKKKSQSKWTFFFAILDFAIIEESLLQGYHFRLHQPIAFLTVAVADFSSYEKGKVRQISRINAFLKGAKSCCNICQREQLRNFRVSIFVLQTCARLICSLIFLGCRRAPIFLGCCLKFFRVASARFFSGWQLEKSWVSYL